MNQIVAVHLQDPIDASQARWRGVVVYTARFSQHGCVFAEKGLLVHPTHGSMCAQVAGSLADTLGRKRGALAYVVVYAASCVTKHWRSYEVLMFGRVLGGIATSLLFSVFDSWLVAEHASRGFEPAWLSTTFANAQAGNSIVAILSGVLGEWIAGTTPMRVLVAGSTGGEDAAPDGAIMWGGYCLPFDAAAVFLLIGGFVIMTTWNENYGDTKQSSGADGLRESLTKGLLLLARDRRVLLVGLVCSCFEAAMYAFVFEWTPALTAANAPR